jgi:hypothetical protein
MNGSQKFIVYGLVFALIVAGGTALYFYNAYSKVMGQVGSQAATSSANDQAIIKDLVTKVGKLIVLPSNETPTVATVVDPSVLKSQPFFANAKKGDAVLIYTSAKTAILYDPAVNKIVNVAPITIGSPAPNVPAATSTK